MISVYPAKFKHLLTLCAFGIALLSGDARAAEVAPVEAAPEGVVFVELYSSQACAFCPAADRLFDELVKSPGVVGFACHVDYFDVRQGALSQRFCSERQRAYMETLRSGPYYTPQMILNGVDDVRGHDVEGVKAGLEAARRTASVGAVALTSVEGQKDGWAAHIPAADLAGQTGAVWIVLYDRLHKVRVAEGPNAGVEMVYANIASAMTKAAAWDGTARKIVFRLNRTTNHAGFLVFAQNMVSGRILFAVNHPF